MMSGQVQVPAVHTQRHFRAVLPLLGVLLSAGCGAHAATDSPQRPSSAVAAAPPQLAAVLDQPFGATPNTIRLIDGLGVQVASAPLRSDAEALAVAGQRLLIAGGGRLQAVGRDGVLTDLGAIPDDDSAQIVRGLVASADGSRWIWAAVRQNNDGTVRSRIYLQQDGGDPRLLLEQTETGHAMQPVAWTAGGVVVGDEPIGIGGYVLFRRSFGATSVLDLSTARLRPLSTDACAFSDLAADGTMACVLNGREAQHPQAPVTVRVGGPSMAAFDVVLPASVAQAGAALFRPGGGTLTLASSPANGYGAEVVQTQLVDLTTHAQRPYGGAGIIPVAWFRDGRLLADRLPGTAGGDAGTFVVSSDGSSTQPISTDYTLIGLLA